MWYARVRAEQPQRREDHREKQERINHKERKEYKKKRGATEVFRPGCCPCHRRGRCRYLEGVDQPACHRRGPSLHGGGTERRCYRPCKVRGQGDSPEVAEGMRFVCLSLWRVLELQLTEQNGSVCYEVT